jgi:hypothetical protein
LEFLYPAFWAWDVEVTRRLALVFRNILLGWEQVDIEFSGKPACEEPFSLIQTDVKDDL